MTVRSFDSFDDMLEAMQEGTRQANIGLNERQQDLRDDYEHTRYWVSPNHEEQILAFGVVFSAAEARDRSIATMPPGLVDLDSEDLDEVLYEIDMYQQNRAAGYLFGEQFSIYIPDGELMDTHVSVVMPISKEAFEEARAAGWRAVVVPSFDLALMGPEAARKGGWTPTLVEEMHEIDAYLREVQ